MRQAAEQWDHVISYILLNLIKEKKNNSNKITKREISLLTDLWSLHPRKDGKRATAMKLKENVLNILMRTKTTDLHIYGV